MRHYRNPKSHTADLASHHGRPTSVYDPHVTEAEAIARNLLPAPTLTEDERRRKYKARITLRKFSWET